MKKKTLQHFRIVLPALWMAFVLTGCQQPAEEAEEHHHDHHDHHDHESVDYEPHGDDMGMLPWAVNIADLTNTNGNYRHAMWTGNFMQLAFMSLQPGEKINLELHNHHDQFIRVEQGEALVLMGKSEDAMTFNQQVAAGWGIMIPAGYWHEVQNTGDTELKLYTIYGPSEHKPGTIHATYKAAIEDHHHDHDH
jgi:mannose-6-phosphate isomerase-like protein (cupin superfamily)